MVLTDLENVLNASPWKDHPRQVIQLEEFDQIILSLKVEGSIAFKAWQAYGAELVAHFGTMLQFVVSRPPQTLDQAFALAVQQNAVAPCTLALPGVSLREHVRALMCVDKWFLHERP
jgi:hypothetical protein